MGRFFLKADPTLCQLLARRLRQSWAGRPRMGGVEVKKWREPFPPLSRLSRLDRLALHLCAQTRSNRLYGGNAEGIVDIVCSL